MLSVRGIPDYIGCVKGRFVALELKKDARAASKTCKLQEYILSKIKQAGGIAEVVHPENFQEIHDQLLAL